MNAVPELINRSATGQQLLCVSHTYWLLPAAIWRNNVNSNSGFQSAQGQRSCRAFVFRHLQESERVKFYVSKTNTVQCNKV